MQRWSGALLASLTGLVLVSVDASVLTPPTLPLIVRNPYLNAHLANARDVPWSKWPTFWTGQEIGMSIMAAVPDSHLVYPLLGRPYDSLDSAKNTEHYNISFPTYLGAQFDVSTTNLTYRIPPPSNSSSQEPLDLTVSFFSPITPDSTVRQSIPASYVEITSSGSFDVEVYMDINGLWATAERGAELVWNFTDIKYENTPSIKTWEIKRKHQMKFAEIADRAEYGSLYFTGPADATYASGDSAWLRQGFARRGVLTNKVDKDFRRVMDREPVFAFHKSLLSKGNSSAEKCVFTVAHVRDEVAQFAAERGLTLMRPLWASYFLTDHALLMYHYLDLKKVKALAAQFSAKMIGDASKSGGQDHVDILALTARQVMGATDFTGTKDSPLIFLKEISSDGNAQTIDVIYPAFPFFSYVNPTWLAYLLEPLIEHMLSGQYPNKYAMHDLGFHYPNLTGHPLGLEEYMPLEESGNMLIMALSLVNSLLHGDSKSSQLTSTAVNVEAVDPEHIFPLRFDMAPGALVATDAGWYQEARSAKQAEVWVKRAYTLFKQWTEYLVDFSLEPENQLSTDDFAGWLSLQTNLALKGIVGIKAMSELSALIGEKEDVKYYKVLPHFYPELLPDSDSHQNISDTYIAKWQEYGMSRDGSHAKLAYNWYGSWTTLYSLFADSLLCFHSKPSSSSSSIPSSSVFEDQAPISNTSPREGVISNSNFIPHGVYKNQSSHYILSLQKYGLPLDARHLYTKSDWEFQIAAISSPALQKEIIHRTARWLNETKTSTPFSDLYDTEYEGNYAPGTRFTARPVVGSHFSILAMQEACGGSAVGGLREWDDVVEAENLRLKSQEPDWVLPDRRRERMARTPPLLPVV